MLTEATGNAKPANTDSVKMANITMKQHKAAVTTQAFKM